MRRGDNIDLGSVEEDVSGIEVIRYVAPILLVKPVDEKGNVVGDCTPILLYKQPAKSDEIMNTYTTGSHVNFETQPDGRWRSSQLLPDEEFYATVKKKGYRTTPQEMSLGEGAEKETVFVMEKEQQKVDPNAYDNGVFVPEPNVRQRVP